MARYMNSFLPFLCILSTFLRPVSPCGPSARGPRCVAGVGPGAPSTGTLGRGARCAHAATAEEGKTRPDKGGAWRFRGWGVMDWSVSWGEGVFLMVFLMDGISTLA